MDVHLISEYSPYARLVPTRIDKHDDQLIIEIDMTLLLLAGLILWIAVIPLTVVVSALM